MNTLLAWIVAILIVLVIVEWLCLPSSLRKIARELEEIKEILKRKHE